MYLWRQKPPHRDGVSGIIKGDVHKHHPALDRDPQKRKAYYKGICYCRFCLMNSKKIHRGPKKLLRG